MAEQGAAKKDDFVGKRLAEVRGFWDRLPTRTRLLMLVIIVLAVGGAVALAMYERTDERVLFSGLTAEDAAAIVEHLKSEKVPFRIDSSGGTILVPAAQVHELRLALASQGIPAGGGVGFELFQKYARFGDLGFDVSIGAAANTDTNGAGRAVTRQANDAHVVAEVFAAELGPDSQFAGEEVAEPEVVVPKQVDDPGPRLAQLRKLREGPEAGLGYRAPVLEPEVEQVTEDVE